MLELLSPAGSMEAVKAAVQNGADAVYLGLGSFNARINARNFTAGEFSEAVRYCHIRGAKVYVTLNTLLSDRELSQAAECVAMASREGADAVIVQDLGMVRLIRQIAPKLPIHASTQMSIHNLDGARYAQSMGISRVVLARELTKQQIAYICRNCDIEVEVFVHGALCMSYSGQCYMSAMIGRRSGNRGLCAQPCRLEYGFGKRDAAHPLSLKDNCLVSHLEELEKIGVSCVKIEGRMKRPEYVAVATRIYAAAIKENRAPTEGELNQLESAFSRQGFTDGYYEGKTGPDMFGVREDGEKEPKELFAAARASYENSETPRVPVRYYAAIQKGEKAMLAVQDDLGNTCKAEGPIPEIAVSRPLTETLLQKQLEKSGGTPYYCTGVRAAIGGGLSLPVSAINAMRRDALAKLTAQRGRITPGDFLAYREGYKLVNSQEEPEMTVSVMHASQITSELVDLSPRVLYIPLSEAIQNEKKIRLVQSNPKITLAVSMPRVIGDHECAGIKKQLDAAYELGIREALCGNVGQFSLARSRGFAIRGDFGLNVYNSLALEQLRQSDLLSATVSFEMTLAQIRDLSKPMDVELIAYGRLPLMVLENCIIKNRTGQCTCDGTVQLVDRTGQRFPVERDPGTCRNLVLNAHKLYLADKYAAYSKIGVWAVRLMFTTENSSEVVQAVRDFARQTKFEPKGYTRGLYYRGVE